MRHYHVNFVLLLLLALLFTSQVGAQRPPAPDPATIVSNVPDSPLIPIPRTAPEFRTPLAPPPVESMEVAPKPQVEPTLQNDNVPEVLGDCVEYPKEGEPGMDYSKLISSSSWGVQVCRAENNDFYAVVQVAADATHPNNWLKVYRCTGNPAMDTWTYLVGFYNTTTGNAYNYPDIEIVSSNNKGYVIFTMSNDYVRLFWFNLDPYSTGGFVTIRYDAVAQTNLTHCSITSDEIEYSGSSVYLYACYRVWDYIESLWMIGFKRSTDAGLTWTDEVYFGAGVTNLPTGNAIAYCPGDDHVHVCFSNQYWDVIVQESGLFGVAPWTYNTAMSSTTYNIYSWGITSNYNNYILVTGDAMVSSPDWDVVYAYSSDGGTSWSSLYYFNWLGDQEYATCTSNNDGYFGLLYYYDDGSTSYWMESSKNIYTTLNSTAAWDWETVDNVNYYDGLTSACMEDGTSPRYGGAWSTGGSSLASSYFGWNGTIPAFNVTLTPVSPPIVVPATGGSFNFNAAVIRNLGPQAAFWVWARIRNPNATYTAPTIGPVQINPPVGVSVSRNRTQTVPSSWVSGSYYYIGYAHTAVSYPATDADSFPWTKSATLDGGPLVWDASCYGELFPGEVPATSLPGEFAVLGANPNPFNPTTAIGYQLSTDSHVSLRVYDTAGRMVTELVNGMREAGSHQVTFDGSNLASGVYLYTLTAGVNHATGKIVLMK